MNTNKTEEVYIKKKKQLSHFITNNKKKRKRNTQFLYTYKMLSK